MRTAIRLSVIASIAVQFSGCPSASVRILIANGWQSPLTHVTFFDSNIQGGVQIELGDPVQPATAKYVILPDTAKGGNFFGIFFEDQTEINLIHGSFTVGESGLDVLHVSSSPSLGWVKLSE